MNVYNVRALLHRNKLTVNIDCFKVEKIIENNVIADNRLFYIKNFNKIIEIKKAYIDNSYFVFEMFLFDFKISESKIRKHINLDLQRKQCF